MSSRFCPNVPDSSDGYSLLGAPGIRGETAAVSETREALRHERGKGESRRASQEGGRGQAPRGYSQVPKRRNRPSGCNRAVKQGRLKKQRIRESGGDISAQRMQPPRLRLQSRVERFETENLQRGGKMAQAFVNTAETTRPRRGCPTGSGVNGRPPKLADGNMAPHMILSPEPFSVRQT